MAILRPPSLHVPSYALPDNGGSMPSPLSRSLGLPSRVHSPSIPCSAHTSGCSLKVSETVTHLGHRFLNGHTLSRCSGECKQFFPKKSVFLRFPHKTYGFSSSSDKKKVPAIMITTAITNNTEGSCLKMMSDAPAPINGARAYHALVRAAPSVRCASI